MSVAGFWRRTIAFGIDLLFLCAVGFAIGTTFKPFLMHYGVEARVIGYTIATLYFTLFNALIFGSQTIGQMLIRIKVVNRYCRGISLCTSFLRALVVTAPFWMTLLINPQGQILSGGFHWIFLTAILSATSFYLLVFNRATRQSLHDLVVHTYVVDCSAESVRRKKVWFGHYMMVVLVFTGTIPAALFAVDIMNELSSQEKELHHVRQVLVEQDQVKDAALSFYSYNVKTIDGDVTYTGVKVRIVTDDNELLDHNKVFELAKAVHEKCSSCQSLDYVNITLNYGYDIGLWSAYDSYGYVFEENDFNRKLSADDKI